MMMVSDNDIDDEDDNDDDDIDDDIDDDDNTIPIWFVFLPKIFDGQMYHIHATTKFFIF